MEISYLNLKKKIPEITALLFTHPNNQHDEASEIWIKFRNSGYYVYINFEQPFPTILRTEKLVGSGNALNCSDYKKDNQLIQYAKTAEVLSILDSSTKFGGNIADTVQKTKILFDGIASPFLYY